MKHITPTAIKLVIASSSPLEATNSRSTLRSSTRTCRPGFLWVYPFPEGEGDFATHLPDDFFRRFWFGVIVNFHDLPAAQADHAIGGLGQRGVVGNDHDGFVEPVFQIDE